MAKKVKKVVPVIYNEYFTTSGGKLVPKSTINSLQGVRGALTYVQCGDYVCMTSYALFVYAGGEWHKTAVDPLGNPLFLEVVQQVFPPSKKLGNRGDPSLLQKFTTKTIAFLLFCVYSNLLCTEGIGGWALEYLTMHAPQRLTPQEAQVRTLCVGSL